MAGPLKFRRAKKRPKFGAISDNFWICSRITPESFNISQIGKVFYQLQPLPLPAKKCVNFGPQTKKVIGAHIDPPMRTYFGRPHFDPWGCCPWNFFHALQIDQALLSHTKTGTRVPTKNESWKFKIWLKIERVSPYNFAASGSVLTKLSRRRAASYIFFYTLTGAHMNIHQLTSPWFSPLLRPSIGPTPPTWVKSRLFCRNIFFEYSRMQFSAV